MKWEAKTRHCRQNQGKKAAEERKLCHAHKTLNAKENYYYLAHEHTGRCEL